MNVYEKLQKIQQELKVHKNNYNSFGRYKYRSCEDIVEAVKPLLDKYNATLVITDEMVNLGDRYYVKATATLHDIEGDGELRNNNIFTTGFAREELNKKGMDVSQVTGAASSYARKYALNGLFCIDDTKDSDFTNTTGDNIEVPFTGGEDLEKENAEFKTLAQAKLEETTTENITETTTRRRKRR